MRTIQEFKKDESGIAYLIVYAILSMFIFGLTYSIVSDVRDIANPLYTNISANAGYLNDSDSQYGLDFLNFLLSFSVAFFVFGLLWYLHSMSQKPELPYQ